MYLYDMTHKRGAEKRIRRETKGFKMRSAVFHTTPYFVAKQRCIIYYATVDKSQQHLKLNNIPF